MKIRAFALLLAILSLTSRTQAVTVEWDRMHSVYSEVWDSGPIWHVLGGNVDRGVYFDFFFYDYGMLRAGAFGTTSVSVWVRQMCYGDVVDAESMLGEDLTYFYQAEKGKTGIRSDYDVPGNAYLAMCVVTMTREPYYAYGWVELSGTDVRASAWDLDGGPMIVGGGSAIPEPSSAQLLLVCGALLALKRRRGYGLISRLER